jgi:glycine/D-amino acid oxidase-like deaminating enzyme
VAHRSIPVDPNGPLVAKNVMVYGAGPLGLYAALALSSNGASVTLAADAPIEKGTGFMHAAGLHEPVATSDPRAARWFAEGVEFAAQAVDDPAWAITPRKVLLMSDHEELTRQDWIAQVPNRPATAEELNARRGYGVWFDTYVIQPDLALQAFERELGARCRAFGGVGSFLNMRVSSVAQAAQFAATRGADAFVLALGLGLAELDDIDEVAHEQAGLSAGLGLTIRMPIGDLGLDHVIMDADTLGYLIPQRTQIVCGGTNVPVTVDDQLVSGKGAASRVEHDRWEQEVRRKVGALWPPLVEFTSGKRLVGARPLRHEVLTAATDSFEIPGILIGGAGGSGWTFAAGIANDSCKFIAETLGVSKTPHRLALVDAAKLGDQAA